MVLWLAFKVSDRVCATRGVSGCRLIGDDHMERKNGSFEISSMVAGCVVVVQRLGSRIRWALRDDAEGRIGAVA